MKGFLEAGGWDTTLDDFLEGIEERKQEYVGFNLLLGELDTDSGTWTIGYGSNREPGRRARVVPKGTQGEVRGLSNDTLVLEGDGPRWPKVESGCSAVSGVLRGHDREEEEEKLVEGLWEALSYVDFISQFIRSKFEFLGHFLTALPIRIQSLNAHT